jgi:hypothetical protein
MDTEPKNQLTPSSPTWSWLFILLTFGAAIPSSLGTHGKILIAATLAYTLIVLVAVSSYFVFRYRYFARHHESPMWRFPWECRTSS